VMQQRIEASTYNGNNNTAGYVRAHGEINGTTSTFGKLISGISRGVPYLVTLYLDTDNNGALVLVQDAVTFAFIGASWAASDDTGNVTSMILQTYLWPHEGTIEYDFLAMDWTNRTFPVVAFHLPPVTALSGLNSDTGEVTLTWTSYATHFQIERNVNGGAYSTIETGVSVPNTPNTYADDGLAAGSYRYRIVAKVGGVSSTAVTSDAIVVA
jgi:hypothetical protein